jgi:L-alanine-DL-glutamate epimerase-like enolase superfamily enzyme
MSTPGFKSPAARGEVHAMKITTVTTWVENLKLTRPYTIAYATFDHVEVAFVRLETAAGIVGWGSGSPVEPVTGESVAACSGALKDSVEELLQGQDVRRLPALLRRAEERLATTPAALAAVDIALHDLYAQHLGLPLVEVLGRAHDRLPTSITVGIKETARETLEEVREYLGRGFRILKLKTGRGVEEDLASVRLVREEVGARAKIRVDANQGYSAEDFRRFLRGAVDLDLEFVEQPLSTELLVEQRALSPEARGFSAGDESIKTAEQALFAVTPPRPFGIFNIKLMKCGGIGPAWQIANIARLSGIELMWGCMDESAVSIAAALHAALASPATRYLDLDGSFDLARDLVSGGFVLEDGTLRVTEAAGLGVRAH